METTVMTSEPPSNARLVTDVVADLVKLEVDVSALRLQWFKLPTWLSAVRPLQTRFLQLDAEVREQVKHIRAMRTRNWQMMTNPGTPVSNIALLPALELPSFDRETAMTSQLERVRFILTAKEGEAHARRGVYLGALGALLGVIGVLPMLRDLIVYVLRAVRG